MPYKYHINSYITSYQKQMIENQLKNEANMQKAEAIAAQKSEQRAQQIAASIQKEKEEQEKNSADKDVAKYLQSSLGK